MKIAGDIDLLPAAPVTRFYQQQEPIDARDSIVNEALAIDFHRSIYDEYSCQTFTCFDQFFSGPNTA